MKNLWPLSRELFSEILADRITDKFVCKLIWERLDYQPIANHAVTLSAGASTPDYWSRKFPQAPEVISQRSASVHLTRSIPKEYKQSLKNYLNFEGYRIDELFPRRTRRATVVNWLVAWTLIRGEDVPPDGPLPPLSEIPVNPLEGHPGDPRIE